MYQCLVCGNPWSKRKKKTQGSQRVIVRRLNPSSSTNQRVLRNLFPRPDVATVSHFAVFPDVVVQLQDSQAAARGKRRKAAIRDTSGIDHWGVTNLSAPISIAVQGHCNVFRHVMQLSLLVLCWKSTLAVILPEIKKKRSLSKIYFAARTFNELPKHLQSIKNFSEFKRRAQQHFLSYSCPCSHHANRSA